MHIYSMEISKSYYQIPKWSNNNDCDLYLTSMLVIFPCCLRWSPSWWTFMCMSSQRKTGSVTGSSPLTRLLWAMPCRPGLSGAFDRSNEYFPYKQYVYISPEHFIILFIRPTFDHKMNLYEKCCHVTLVYLFFRIWNINWSSSPNTTSMPYVVE